jgi:hypothetical protein
MDAAAKELQFANLLTLIHSPRYSKFPEAYQRVIWSAFHTYMKELEAQVIADAKNTTEDSVK